MDLRDWISAPFRVFSLGARIGLRITVGIAGFALMGVGLLLIRPFGLPAAGIPVFVVGLLLTLKAIF
jgi:hypothetical protein